MAAAPASTIQTDELRLTLRVDGSAAVAHLQAGTLEWEEPVRIAVDPDEIDEALGAVSRVSRQGVLRSSGRSKSLDPVQALGARLFSAVFEGRLGRIYSDAISTATDAGRTLPVRVIADDARLAALPWEFLYDPRRGDFVALSTRSPLVRQLDAPPPPPRVPITPPIRVLLACADPLGNLGTERDVELLRRLETSGRSALAVTVVQSATADALRAALEGGQYHVVHFSGTAVDARRERSGDGFDSGPRRDRAADQLLALVSGRDGEPDYEMHPVEAALAGLRRQSQLRFVLLSACYTDRAANVLVPMGVPAVIGWRGLVAVDACVHFAHGLYRALLDGAPLETAVTEGRRLIALELPGARDWGMAVFHLQAPSGTPLAPPPPQGTSGAAARPAPSDAEKRPEWSALASRLDVYERNLDALLAESTRFGAALPEFIRSQIEDAAGRLRDQSERAGANLPAPLEQRLREARERLVAVEQMLGPRKPV
jgi:hypothetical protein